MFGRKKKFKFEAHRPDRRDPESLESVLKGVKDELTAPTDATIIVKKKRHKGLYPEEERQLKEAKKREQEAKELKPRRKPRLRW